MVNCEHVIVQRVHGFTIFVSCILINHSKWVYPRLLKLGTQYTKDFPRYDCARNTNMSLLVGRKVNNASGFYCRRNFASACSPTRSQNNNLAWARDPIENPLPGQQLTWKNFELLAWAHDMDTWYWSAETLLLHLSINMVIVLLSYFSRHGTEYGRPGTYVRTVTWHAPPVCKLRTYGQSHDNPNFWGRWVTNFSKVWGSASAP